MWVGLGVRGGSFWAGGGVEAGSESGSIGAVYTCLAVDGKRRAGVGLGNLSTRGGPAEGQKKGPGLRATLIRLRRKVLAGVLPGPESWERLWAIEDGLVLPRNAEPPL